MSEIREKAEKRFYQLIQKGIDRGRIKLSKQHAEILAKNLEAGIFNYAIKLCRKCGKSRTWEEPAFKEYYKEKFAYIATNLDIDNNETLLVRLAKGEITADDLSAKERFDKQTQTTVFGMTDNEILDIKEEVEEVNETEGIFKCKYCKSTKTSYRQQQTRGADEPMTNIVSCRSCGKTSFQ